MGELIKLIGCLVITYMKIFLVKLVDYYINKLLLSDCCTTTQNLEHIKHTRQTIQDTNI